MRLIRRYPQRVRSFKVRISPWTPGFNFRKNQGVAMSKRFADALSHLFSNARFSFGRGRQRKMPKPF